jgi:PAS domain S-box-containing protein/putative nucleotidyltransferase with HDIG domain
LKSLLFSDKEVSLTLEKIFETVEEKNRMTIQKPLRSEPVLELEILRQRIRELEARELQRKEVEDLYRNVANSSYTGFYIVQNRKLQFVNPYLQKLTGYREEDLLGRDVLDFLHPDDRKAVKEKIAAILKTDRYFPFEYRIMTREGDVKWIMDSVSPISHNGEPAVFGNALDITERKQAAEELRLSLNKLRKTMESTVQAMSVIVETRDPYTSGHQEQVSRLARAIGDEMGLSEERLQAIHMSAIIHDIGKIYVPAEILSKPGKLSDMEFQMMKTHPEVGYNILKTIEFPYPVAMIVYQHHERMNGSGYPLGLIGKDILMEARIIGVADVIDAMAAHRPYRAAIGIEEAMDEISQNRGFLYDPLVVNACLKLFKEKGFPFA